jgi:hypothetical protein
MGAAGEGPGGKGAAGEGLAAAKAAKYSLGELASTTSEHDLGKRTIMAKLKLGELQEAAKFGLDKLNGTNGDVVGADAAKDGLNKIADAAKHGLEQLAHTKGTLDGLTTTAAQLVGLAPDGGDPENPAAANEPTTEEDKPERNKLVDFLEKFLRLLIQIIRFIMAFFMFLPALWGGFWALICMIVLGAVVYGICYMIFVTNPRMPMLWHSEDLESYMSEFNKDMIAAVEAIRDNHGVAAPALARALGGGSAGAADNVFRKAVAVLGSRALAEDMDTYFQFHDQISDFGFLAQRDLRNNAPQFVTGEDDLDVSEYRDGFLRPMDDLANGAEGLSQLAASVGDRLLRPREVLRPQQAVAGARPDARGNVRVEYDVFLPDVVAGGGDEPAFRHALLVRADGSLFRDLGYVELRKRGGDGAILREGFALGGGEDGGDGDGTLGGFGAGDGGGLGGLGGALGGLGAAPVAAGDADAPPGPVPFLPAWALASDEAVAYVGALHQVRMMMMQRADIGVKYQSRRKKLPFGIWTIYYAPLLVSMFFSFTAYWAKFPKRWVNTFTDTINWWMGLGPWIATIPCKMAYSDPVERSEKCRSNLVDTFVPEETKPQDEQAADVVEHFMDLGGIVTALSSIGDFFVNIAMVAIKLGLLFAMFPIDPFGSIIGIISIIVGIIIGLLLMYVWILMTIMMFPLLLAYWWTMISVFAMAILYTAWLIVLSILLAIPYFGLWLIDMPTGGFVVRMMHCENSPGQWHSRNAYSDDNTFVRYFPFCMRPCATRYTKSWSGCCCDKLPAFMPDLCPQQQVYELAHGAGAGAGAGIRASTGIPALGGGPVAFARYTGNAVFQHMSVDGKRKVLVSAFKKKAAWYQRCYESLSDWDFLNRHLCSVFDRLGLDDGVRQKLALVCNECYCLHRPVDNTGFSNMNSAGIARMTDAGWQPEAPNGGNESLCRDLQRQVGDGGGEEPPPPGPALLRKALMLALVALCGLLALYSMTHAGSKLLQ